MSFLTPVDFKTTGSLKFYTKMIFQNDLPLMDVNISSDNDLRGLGHMFRISFYSWMPMLVLLGI